VINDVATSCRHPRATAPTSGSTTASMAMSAWTKADEARFVCEQWISRQITGEFDALQA
jgi:hypothetical protein